VLTSLFQTITVPPVVAAEIGPLLAKSTSIQRRVLAKPIDLRVAMAALGPGESEAISLAIESAADHVILDESAGRRLAEQLGLPVIGIVGLLVVAKQQLVMPEIRPIVEALLGVGFRLSPAVIGSALRSVGETPDAEPQATRWTVWSS
jgi:predicted nucleic acid-binding protein